MSRTAQTARVLDSVIKPAFADKIPARDPSLSDLIDWFIHYDTCWTPENDGRSHDLAQAIRLHLKDEMGLTDAQCDALGGAL